MRLAALTNVDITVLDKDHLAVDLVGNVVNVLTGMLALLRWATNRPGWTTAKTHSHVVGVREHLVAGEDVLEDQHAHGG